MAVKNLTKVDSERWECTIDGQLFNIVKSGPSCWTYWQDGSRGGALDAASTFREAVADLRAYANQRVA